MGDGWAQEGAAAFRGVHRVAVAKWVARHRADKDNGLKSRPTPGRPRVPTAARAWKVLAWPAESPPEHGFDTDRWTARRVAERVRRTFGARFHPNDLREWRTERNGRPQKPARRARQRDPAAVARWVAEDGPRIHKRRATNAPTSSGSTGPARSSARGCAAVGPCPVGRP